MKEGFLHYLWNYQLFDISKLTTVQGDAITILKRGIYNHNSGPDFLNSKIEIANQLWFGNIKIHKPYLFGSNRWLILTKQSL